MPPEGEAAVEAPVEEAAPAQPEQPASEEGASPPDVSEALSQMHESITQLASRIPEAEQQQAPDPWSRFAGLDEVEEDYYEDEPASPQQPDQAQQPSEGQQFEQQVQGWIQQAVQQAVGPVFQQQELQRREQEISELADKYPRLREPEVLNTVADDLEKLEAQQGLPRGALSTNPLMVERFYLAHEAQTSQGADESAQEGTAEAVGQQGVELETGAGPGAPPPDVDPQTQAYHEALSRNAKPNSFGF